MKHIFIIYILQKEISFCFCFYTLNNLSQKDTHAKIFVINQEAIIDELRR